MIIRDRRFVSAFILLIVCTASSLHADRAFFIVDGQLQWRTLSSPIITTVGPISAGIRSLTFDDQGRLFGVDDLSRFLEIDPETAEVTIIRNNDFEFSEPLDLFFDDQGRLWSMVFTMVPMFFGSTTIGELDPVTGKPSDTLLNLGIAERYIFASGEETESTGEFVVIEGTNVQRMNVETGALGAPLPITPPLTIDALLTGGDIDSLGRIILFSRDSSVSPAVNRLLAVDPDRGDLTTLPGEYTFGFPSEVAILRGGAQTLEIPTLGTTGIMMMAFFLAVAGALVSRRRRPGTLSP